MTSMHPGDVGSILVVYLGDRNGKALVRLPNGSKTSLPHDSLDFCGLRRQPRKAGLR